MSNYTIPKPQVNSNLDSVQKTKLGTEKKQQICTSEFFPRLVCQINLYNDQLILSQHGREFAFQTNELSGQGLYKLFLLMDGTRSLHELQQLYSPENPTAITKLLCSLDDQGLVDDAAPMSIHSGRDTLLELEALTQELLTQTISDHSVTDIRLWQVLQLATPTIPDMVIYGFALEHYHLFSHLGSCQAPTLNFQESTKIRHLLNQLYTQTCGYEQLMASALNGIGISSKDLSHSLPLPETMSLYNGLTFWANFEPLFFLAILGPLYGGLFSRFEHYLTVIEDRDLEGDFIKPMGQLINTQQKHKQVILAQSIFQEIPHVDLDTEQRLKGQIHLFTEIYRNFYRAIGQCYLNTPNLLRQVSVS